jgi:hypothetical protein
MRAANARGAALGLSDDELAVYDALEVNDSAVQVLGEPMLQTMACELTESVRRVTLDKVLPELRPFGGTVLRTSLSHEQEERLRQARSGGLSAATSTWGRYDPGRSRRRAYRHRHLPRDHHDPIFGSRENVHLNRTMGRARPRAGADDHDEVHG